MPLPDELFSHTLNAYPATTARDAGGGVVLTYSGTPTVSGAACIVQAASADVAERFDKLGLRVTHSISMYPAAVLQSDKVVTYDEAGDSAGDFVVRGIRRQPGVSAVDVPSFMYLDCEQLVD